MQNLKNQMPCRDVAAVLLVCLDWSGLHDYALTRGPCIQTDASLSECSRRVSEAWELRGRPMEMLPA